MKATIKEPATEFKPVKLELTFETKEELYAMLAVTIPANYLSAYNQIKPVTRSEAEHKATNNYAWGKVSTAITQALKPYWL